MLYILGTWKLLGAIVLAMPEKPLWKEWAYAGFFFDFSGAIVTHLFVGDMMFPAPTIFLLILIGSYKLRPADRRLPST